MWFVISFPFWMIAALCFCTGCYALVRDPGTDKDVPVGFSLLVISSGVAWVAAVICGAV